MSPVGYCYAQWTVIGIHVSDSIDDINMGIVGIWVLGEKVVVILCKPSCDTNSAQKHYGDNSEEYFVVFVKKDKKDDRNS